MGPPPPPAAGGGAARRGSGCRARNSQACQGGAGCERGAAEEASCDRRVLARVMHAWLSSHPPAPTSCRLPVAFLPSSRILPELARGGLHPKPPHSQLPPSRASFHLQVEKKEKLSSEAAGRQPQPPSRALASPSPLLHRVRARRSHGPPSSLAPPGHLLPTPKALCERHLPWETLGLSQQPAGNQPAPEKGDVGVKVAVRTGLTGRKASPGHPWPLRTVTVLWGGGAHSCPASSLQSPW